MLAATRPSRHETPEPCHESQCFNSRESYAVAVVSQNGEALPVLDAGPSFGGITGPQKIPAKGAWVRRLFLPHWITLAAAGNYAVSCKTVLKLSKHTPGNWEHNEKTTDIKVEVKTSLKVVPTDEKRLGELIEALGNRIRRLRDATRTKPAMSPSGEWPRSTGSR